MKSFIPFLLMTLLVVGCSSPTSSTPAASATTPTASTAKALTAFSFAGLSPVVTGTVTESTHTVAVTVPYGTALTALVATFTTTGASVKVGTTSQVSATTANNFTSPVTYTVTAADGSTQAYTVTVVVSAVSLSGIVTTLAGSVAGGSFNATGTAASFSSPTGVATDGTNVYVADSSNNLIRKIVISTGVVTTLAGSLNSGSTNATGTAASFDFPVGLATDGTKLFVADGTNTLIRQIVIGTGAVTTLAGSGTAGSLNATGTAASFNGPTGVATDGANLYVADQGNKLLRKIVISTGVVTTLAGSGTAGSLNATGTAASFSRPYGVAMNANVPSQLFVADQTNNLIREIQ